MIVTAGGRRTPRTWLGIDDLDLVFLVGFLILAIPGVIFVANLRHLGGQWQQPTRRAPRGWQLVFLLAVVLLVWRPEALEGLDQVQESLESLDEPVPGPTDDPTTTDRRPIARVVDVLLVGVVLAVVGGVLLRLRGRAVLTETHEDGSDLPTGSDIDVVIDRARRALLAADDDRSAVLNAYAELEDFIASCGLERRPAETASEHLTRALTQLDVDPARLGQLPILYERARFSDYTITSVDRTAALEGLGTTASALERTG